MHGRRLCAYRDERVRIGLGNCPGIEPIEAVSDFARAYEGDFHRDLLIEQHPDQQCERIFGQQCIGGWV